MRFREGLLKARGQIAFLVALACSTIAIIYLEAFDAEARIREQVVAQVSASGQPLMQRSDELEGAIRSAIESSRAAFESDPAPLAHRAGILNAAVLGIAHGVGPADALRRDAEAVVSLVERGNPQEAWELAPALSLLAGALPEFEPRVVALLSAREGVAE